ncbi:GTP-binding protein Rho1 [Phlyctochytrium bullatum]|nr:GTP-binding protein Rho1 [Phlyctochytrium bullatum]
MADGDGKRKKFVFVGDERCGKSCLMRRFASLGDFSEDHVPTVTESYFVEKPTPVYDDEVSAEPRMVMTSIELCDTSGSEELDRLRPLSYDGADLWVVCFSVESRHSLINVIEKWVPEVKYFAPSIPLMLVGCKVDLREDPETLDRLEAVGEVPVTLEEAQEAARIIGAFKYVETSAKLGYQVETMFDDDVDDSGEYVEELDEEEELVEEELLDEEIIEEGTQSDAQELHQPGQSDEFITATSSESLSRTPHSSSTATAVTASLSASSDSNPSTLSISNLTALAPDEPFLPHTHQMTKQQLHRLSRVVPALPVRRSLDENPALPTHAPSSSGSGTLRRMAVTAKGLVVVDDAQGAVTAAAPARRRRRAHRGGLDRRGSTTSSISSLSTKSSVSSLSSKSITSSIRSGLPAGQSEIAREATPVRADGADEGEAVAEPASAEDSEGDEAKLAEQQPPQTPEKTPEPVEQTDPASQETETPAQDATEAPVPPAESPTPPEPTAAEPNNPIEEAAPPVAEKDGYEPKDDMPKGVPAPPLPATEKIADPPTIAPPTKAIYPIQEDKTGVSRVEVVADAPRRRPPPADDGGCKCTIL